MSEPAWKAEHERMRGQLGDVIEAMEISLRRLDNASFTDDEALLPTVQALHKMAIENGNPSPFTAPPPPPSSVAKMLPWWKRLFS